MALNPHLRVKTSVVDRHRFDANPDPDPTFYSFLDPGPDFNVNNTTAARHFTHFQASQQSTNRLVSDPEANDADPNESGSTALVVRTDLCQVYPKDSAAEGR